MAQFAFIWCYHCNLLRICGTNTAEMRMDCKFATQKQQQQRMVSALDKFDAQHSEGRKYLEFTTRTNLNH